MHVTDKKPPGKNVGYVRVHKKNGATYVQIVDLTRYESSVHSVRFREENWITTKDSTYPSITGRTTDDFNNAAWADEHFAWWLKTKLDDGYAILAVEGTPGPLPSLTVETQTS